MNFGPTKMFLRDTARGKPVHCHWCSIKCTKPDDSQSGTGATRDHVSPRSKGLLFDRHSMVWACRACNEVKDNLSPMQWASFMLTFPEFRTYYQAPWLPKFRKDFLAAMEADVQSDFRNEIVVVTA